MSDLIKHAGIVESVVGHKVRVRIVQSPACMSCDVSGKCQISKSREQQIELVSENNDYQNGETVMVVVSRRTALRSVVLAFGVPFLLLLLTVFSVWYIAKDERIAASACLMTLVIYYGMLYILRKQIAEKILIKLEKVKSKE